MKKEEILINIQSVHRIYCLLSVADNKKSILVSEIAKEMGIKRTMLTEFVLDNPDNFVIAQDTKGLTIKQCFLDGSNNPYSKIWLENKKNHDVNTLYVYQWDCYGIKEEYYLPDDSATVDNCKYDTTPPYNNRYWMWRNTTEKMKKVKASGHFHKGTGSTGMWSGTTLPYCLSIEEMKALIADGWTLKGELPNEIRREYYSLMEEDEL